MIDYKLHTPEGVKDYLPDECTVLHEAEKRIEDVFRKHSFRRVKSPTFEYIEVFRGARSVGDREMFKFIDRDGSLLALRSDVTLAVARIAATAYQKEDMPLRFYYIDNAFRYNDNYQGKLREFTQAGIELIGSDCVEADAEVAAVAVKSLIAAGLKDFKVNIGHIDFFNGIVEETGLDEESRQKIRESITSKNFVEVDDIVKNSGADEKVKKIIFDLPLLIGNTEMTAKVKSMITNKKALKAIENIEAVYEILKEYKLEKYINIDLSTIGSFEYYTGIILRGYTYGTGFSVIDGGRYDGLLANYGCDVPSVGFAVKMNELVSALEYQSVKYDLKEGKTLIVYNKESRKTAIETADYLRRKGTAAENSLLGEDIEKNKAYAIKNNIGGILYFLDNENVKVISIKNNTENIVNISELTGREN
ncbi:MAG: ATP phosphoribosyltransferase regulatory subunit [Firmicutes bacterium]|nr:ATP phosphoribosyltransferase regulatory subunit [Bacillota bacterium]